MPENTSETLPNHIHNLGLFKLGYRYVRVYANEQMHGGAFSFNPPDTEHSSIEVGINYIQSEWSHIVAILWHEALEFVMAEMQVRFSQDSSYANNAAEYLFVMDHQKFAECVARAAYFHVQVIDKLWDAHQKSLVNEKKP